MTFIRKRGNNYTLYWCENGKQRTQVVGSDYLAAKICLDNKRAEIESDKRGLANNKAWLRYCEEYLEYSKGNKRHNTYVRDLRTIDTFNELIRVQKISDVTAEVLETYKTKRIEDSKMPNSINRELITIKGMLNRAAMLGYISKSPSPLVKYLKVNAAKPRFLTKEEFDKYIKNVHGVWRTASMIAAYAGFRAGEVRYLEWRDVDFKKGIISVTPKAGWTPKDNEIRHVQMCKTLTDYLSKLKRSWSQWVIFNPDGTQVTAAMLCKKTKIKFNASNLRDCSFHTLRHTFASWLRLKGVSLDVIGELLGHADTETTKIYAHITPAFRQSVINLLD